MFLQTRSEVPADLLTGQASASNSAREVAEKADIVLLMLPDTPDAAAVLFGDEGVASGLSTGKTVVDMSSISPMEAKEFAQKIKALGCDCLDAPVSGGEVGVKAGSNGDGQTCRVANQIIVALTIAAVG